MNIIYGAHNTIYEYLPMAINSLLKTNPTANVYVLAEQDQIENIKHPQVKVINIHNYNLKFDKSHPNFKLAANFTYMANVRLYIPQLFPGLDRVLWLDVDTIVKDKLDELFTIDMTNYAVGMVKENKKDRIYCNSGVCLFNLDYIRWYELDKQFMDKLFGSKLSYPDQDILNQVCKDHILFLDSKYNASYLTEMPSEIKIRHYIYKEKLWNHKNSPEWKEYYVERLTNE